MPTSCCAYGCKNRHVKGSEIQFFSFPFKDPLRLAAWVAATHRADWKSTKATRRCSEHFTASDFLDHPGTYIKHIKPNAVPSVFKAWTTHLQPKEGVVWKEREMCQVVEPDCKASCSTEAPNIIEPQTSTDFCMLSLDESWMDVEDTSSGNEIHIHTNNLRKLNTAHIGESVILSIKRKFALDETIFPTLNCENIDLFERPHKLVLISSICSKFIDIRLYSYGKFVTQEILLPSRRRHQLTKRILFANE